MQKQVLDNCTIRRVWSEIKTSSNYESRLRAVHEFNASTKFRKRGIALIPTKFGCSFTAKFMNQGGALVHGKPCLSCKHDFPNELWPHLHGMVLDSHAVYTDGSVLLTHGGTEMGQGLHTKMAQVVHVSLVSRTVLLYAYHRADVWIHRRSALTNSIFQWSRLRLVQQAQTRCPTPARPRPP